MQNAIIIAFSFPKKWFNNIYISSSEMKTHDQNEYSLGAKKEMQCLYGETKEYKNLSVLSNIMYPQKGALALNKIHILGLKKLVGQNFGTLMKLILSLP